MPKKNSKKQKCKAKDKRLAVTVILLYALSLVIDGLLTAFVLWPMNGTAFFGAYGGYMILGSGVVGLITVYFACLATRRSQWARGRLIPCIVTRSALLLVADIVLMILNPTWCVSESERELGAGIFSVVLLGGIFFGAQALLCGWIAENLYDPTPYVPSVHTTKGSGTSTVSGSDSHIVVTDSVKNTDFYQSKKDEYFRTYMGMPPKEEKKSDYSDLDGHDYSHIFEDKNF